MNIIIGAVDSFQVLHIFKQMYVQSSTSLWIKWKSALEALTNDTNSKDQERKMKNVNVEITNR